VSASSRPWTFLLAPVDQGIRNVGGRPGACQAPEHLWAGLQTEDMVPESARVREVEVDNTDDSLETDLDRLSQAVADELADDRLPIVLGGDHGTTFATVRGAVRELVDVGVAYLDVHLDVRAFEPRHTSGSSFRRLIEEGWVEPEHVRALGIQTPENPEEASGDKAPFTELRAWAREQGLVVEGLDEVRQRPAWALGQALSPGVEWCLSLDVDALDARWAPGVSAPGSPRFTLEEACRAAEAARGGYRVLDVVEYSPPLDEDERTLDSCLQLLAAALGEA